MQPKVQWKGQKQPESALHTLQNFDRIAATLRSTNFENSNANIFLFFLSSFLNRRVKMIKQL
jgi:hypothetical protein